MKVGLSALILMSFLLPAESFANDWRHRYLGGRRAQHQFDREHPRWPRQYCHRHRYPLHSDDKRRHCHNWDREGPLGSYERQGYWPWHRF